MCRLFVGTDDKRAMSAFGPGIVRPTSGIDAARRVLQSDADRQRKNQQGDKKQRKDEPPQHAPVVDVVETHAQTDAPTNGDKPQAHAAPTGEVAKPSNPLLDLRG